MASPQTEPAIRFNGIFGVWDCFVSIAALGKTHLNWMHGQTLKASPELEFDNAALY